MDDADGLAADVLPRLERFEVVEVLTAPPDTPTTEQLVARVLEGDLAAWITLDAATLLDASVRVHGERWLPDEAQADLVGAVRLAALGRLAGPEAERTLRRSGAPPRLVFTALQPGVGEAVTTDLRAVRTLLRQSAIAAFALVLGLLALTPRGATAWLRSCRWLAGEALMDWRSPSRSCGAAGRSRRRGSRMARRLDTGCSAITVRSGAPQAPRSGSPAEGHGLRWSWSQPSTRGDPSGPSAGDVGLGVVVPALAIFVTGVPAMALPCPRPPSCCRCSAPSPSCTSRLGGGVVALLLAATASLLSALALAERFVAWPSWRKALPSHARVASREIGVAAGAAGRAGAAAQWPALLLMTTMPSAVGAGPRAGRPAWPRRAEGGGGRSGGCREHASGGRRSPGAGGDRPTLRPARWMGGCGAASSTHGSACSARTRTR
ncbi:MAG: hypothetical protein H6732_16545 [Alphaproteobacteria bacterium]|nr:hypothetical protein [Alphaproteobacteria bacterium]